MHFKHWFSICLVKLLSASAEQLIIFVSLQGKAEVEPLFYILGEDLQLHLIVGLKWFFISKVMVTPHDVPGFWTDGMLQKHMEFFIIAALYFGPSGLF